MDFFHPADILIPKDHLSQWATVACDQHTSNPSYWKEVERFVGDFPSSLHVILPEVYLSSDNSTKIASINRTMQSYLKNNIFSEYKNALVYLERTLPSGRIRRGIVGAVDLDGDLMQHLLHPSGEINKTYRVSVYGPVAGAAARLSAITDLEGEKIRPAQVEVIRQSGQAAELFITIHEGKNRQIRRMCALCGLTVKRLCRVKEHTLVLGDLPAGKWRHLTAEEVADLKRA